MFLGRGEKAAEQCLSLLAPQISWTSMSSISSDLQAGPGLQEGKGLSQLHPGASPRQRSAQEPALKWVGGSPGRGYSEAHGMATSWDHVQPRAYMCYVRVCMCTRVLASP